MSSPTRQEESFQQLTKAQDHQHHALQQLPEQQQGMVAPALPQPSMQFFGGDPFDYCDFVHAFKHQVEWKTQSPSSRLYYLVQYTSGPVQELMRSCFFMSEQEGNKEAKRPSFNQPLGAVEFLDRICICK